MMLSAHRDEPFQREIAHSNAIAKATLDNFCLFHSTVFPIWTKLIFPENYKLASSYAHHGVSEEFLRFLRTLQKHLHKNGLRAAFIAIRELNSGLNPRHHLLLLVDGSKVQNPDVLWKKMELIWCDIMFDPRPHLVRRGIPLAAHPSIYLIEANASQPFHLTRGYNATLSHLLHLIHKHTEEFQGDGFPHLIIPQVIGSNITF